MPAPATMDPASVRPLRREEYDKMVSLGFFENERVELLYGSVVRMSPHGPPHDSTIQRLTRLMLESIGNRADVRIQSAFAASDGSQPEPDLVVVPRGDYDDAHPDRALLIVEVADSSLRTDRTTKATLYAECGVPEYWVVNLVDKVVEVFREPESGRYARLHTLRPGDTVTIAALGIDLPVAAFVR